MNEIWPGSILSLAESADSRAIVTSTPDMTMVGFLIAVAVLLLVLYQQSYMAMAVSIRVLFSANRAKEYLDDSFSVRSIVQTFILAIPFLACTFVVTGISSRSFWSVLLIVALFFVYRHIAFMFVRWLGGKREAVWNVEKLSYSSFLVMALVMGLVILLFHFVGLRDILVRKTVLSAVALFNLLAYCLGSFKIIVRSGFSGFFWILYLCVFELLPLCVTVDIIIS